MTAIKRLFQDGDVILYLAFLWQLPFSWRFILTENRGMVGGPFNEYMDVSLYLGEVILVCTLALYIFNNKKVIKSINKNIKNRLKNWFHVEQLLPLLALAYLALNTAQSIDPILSLTFIWHASLALLFVVLTKAFIVSRGTSFLKDVFKVVVISLLLQVAISGYQIMNNHSAGLYWLNESKISTETLNVAKSEILGLKILRGYGTFPHPNVLAAFCLLSYVLLIAYKSLFHVEQTTLLLSTVLIGVAILLTGSKTGAFLFLIIFLGKRIKYLFHVKQILIVIVGVITVSLVILYQSDIKQSYSTRIDQFSYQSNFSQATFLGSGLGTYRYSYDSISSPKEWWILEPVHSSVYIIYRELGVIPAGLLFLLAVYFLKLLLIVPRETKNSLFIILTFLITYLMTDHFFWDIQQGMYFFLIALLLMYYYIDNNTKILYKNS